MVNNYAPPEKLELATARRATRALMLKREAEDPVAYFISDSMQEEPIELPEAAVAILRDVLEYMSHGHGITLFPRLAEVTTMEAADILNVSRPYVIKLLEAGDLPFRMVGRHRRIPLNELIAYKSESTAIGKPFSTKWWPRLKNSAYMTDPYRLRALLDANVLASITLTDVLVQLAVDDLYQARWTREIHQEWISAVREFRPDLDAHRLERRRQLMDARTRDALITGYEEYMND